MTTATKKNIKSGKKAFIREDRNFALIVDRDRCKGCGLCVEVCPKDVLILNGYNYRGYPVSTAQKPEECIKCRRCQRTCPDFAIYLIDDVLDNSWAQHTVKGDSDDCE